MKNYTIVRVDQGDVNISDLVPWIETFSDWHEPDLEIGQSAVFVVTRTE